jgi:hypothetical protein
MTNKITAETRARMRERAERVEAKVRALTLALEKANAEYDAATAEVTAADQAFGAAQNAVNEYSSDERLVALITTAQALRAANARERAAEDALRTLDTLSK